MDGGRVAVLGRDPELHRLEVLTRRGRAGLGHTVLLTGPAGIGKTSLAAELADRSHAAGDAVIWARCSSDPGAPDHWAWMQVLRSAVGLVPEEQLVERLGAGLDHLLRAVPGIIERERPTNAEPAAATSELFAFYDAALTVLRAAAHGPLVVIVEDLHWADRSSLRLLDLVARSLEDVPLTVVGTHRDLGPGTDRDVREALDRVARSADVVPLTGLPVETVGELVALRTGRPCPAANAAELHRLTAGNPFLVAHAAQVLVGDGSPAGTSALPASLFGTARASFRRLDEEERQVLASAAVLGTDFDEDTLAALEAEASGRDASLLERLARRGVLRAGDAPGRWSFAHELLREAALDESDAGELARRHLRAAEALGPTGPPGEVAAHLQAAGGLAPPATVAQACLHAARDATERLAHDEAVAWFEASLDQLYRSPTADDGERLDVLLALGSARIRAGRATASLAAYERARTLADHRQDPVAFARAVDGIAEARRRGPGWESHLDDLRPVLADAVERLGDGTDASLRARLLGHLAACAAMSSDPEAARVHAAEATEAAAATDDLPARHAALLAQRWSLVGPAPIDDKVRLTDQLSLLAAQTDDVHGRWWAARWRLYDGLEAGDPALIGQALDASTALAERIGEPDLVVDTLVQRGTVAMLEGRFDELARLHDDARRVAERWEIGQEAILGQELFASRERGELRIDVLRMILEANPRPIYRALVCWGAVNLDQRDEARAQLDHFFPDGGLCELPDGVYLPAILAMLSEAVVLLGDVERASQLRARMAPLAGHCVVAGIGPYVWTGSMHHYLGVLATVVGDLDPARQHLEQARRIHHRMGARPWVLRTELAQARLEADRRGATVGPAVVDHIRDQAGRLGMAALVAELDRTIHRPPRSRTTERRWRLAPDGAVWVLETPERSHRLRARKGLAHLHTLLQRPGGEVHVLELVGGAPGGGAGPALDRRAKEAYRTRVEDLRDQIADGEEWGDAERVHRAREELDAIAAELAGAVGLGGRDRPTGDAGERARVAVTKAVRSAIDHLGEHAPEVATHLGATIRTGLYCAYEPDPLTPVRWELS